MPIAKRRVAEGRIVLEGEALAEGAEGQEPPNTDSIEELAKFWDSHDLTDFEEDLEETGEPVFVRARGTPLSIELQPREARQLSRIARSQGVKESTVLRQWVVEKLHESSPAGARPDKALQPTAQEPRRR